MLQLADLGRVVMDWALWSREPSLSSAASVSTSRNHLTIVHNGNSYPINFRPGSVSIGDLQQRTKPFYFFPSIPLEKPCTAGTSWRVQAPYMVRLVTGSWSYLEQSKLLISNWVGGWDVWEVHQFPTSKFLGVSCKPQNIISLLEFSAFLFWFVCLFVCSFVFFC